MISHTNAFKQYRDLSQAHLNFAVLVCHSVPALSASMNKTGMIPAPPDHFKAGGSSVPDLLGYATKYKEELARSTLITVFSYFEAYVREALVEIIDFHGGKARFLKKAKNRVQQFFGSIPTAMLESKRKLQDSRDPRKLAKYQKHGRLLDKTGFRFPTDLLGPYGVSNLILKADEKRGFKAYEIPDVLEEALLYPLSAADRSKFEAIRKIRNGIAHGGASTIALSKALRYASELHTLAAAVDKHIVAHFLVLQEV
jgi:hypothetical protein